MHSSPEVSVVSFGLGNVGAFVNCFNRAGVSCAVANSPEKVLEARRLVLPGVGSFDAAMTRLTRSGILEALNVVHREGVVPILGVCVGMQVMAASSQEGTLPGLGWFDAHICRFPIDGIGRSRQTNLRDKVRLPTPHMGWNSIVRVRDSDLLDGIDNPNFYFLHSYYWKQLSDEAVIAVSNYGGDFSSVIARGNVYGVQFHPEKSHRQGQTLLTNFARLAAC